MKSLKGGGGRGRGDLPRGRQHGVLGSCDPAAARPRRPWGELGVLTVSRLVASPSGLPDHAQRSSRTSHLTVSEPEVPRLPGGLGLRLPFGRLAWTSAFGSGHWRGFLLQGSQGGVDATWAD